MSERSDRFLDAFYEYEGVYTGMKVEFPGFEIIPKSKVWWMHALALFLKLLSFGHIISFMSTYTSCIGRKVYVGSNWADKPFLEKAATLRHEAVHMRQREKMGFITYALIYLFLPVPVVFALGRRDLEMEAYEETLRAFAQYYGIESLREGHIRIRITDEFMGPNYFWMWPFRKDIDRWYDGVVARLEAAPPRVVHVKNR
jgi:hypothetical protein